MGAPRSGGEGHLGRDMPPDIERTEINKGHRATSREELE